MAATIKDVARLAGVSISTVSRVTNGADNVSPQIKKKVIRAVKALNYTPNIIARSLESRNSKNIAIVMGRIVEKVFSNHGFMMILQGVTQVLSQYGYTPLLTSDTDKTKEMEHCMQLVRCGAVRGVIVTGSFVNDPLIAQLVEEGVPFVLSGYQPSFPDIDTTPFNLVSIDAKASARQAVEHLLELGHRRIGLIHSSLARAVDRRKYDGYLEAVTEAGLKIDHTIIGELGYDMAAVGQMAAGLFGLKKPPTALFCTDDHIAIGMIRAVRALGIEVPGQLSVVGHNNYAIGEVSEPPLTTIDVPRLEMGRQVAQLLVEAMEQPGAKPRSVYLPTKLVIRSTTAPPAV